MWELEYKESWVLRTDASELWCWRRLLRVSWTSKRSNQSSLKGNQSWIFIGSTDVEAETLILWPPDAKKLTHLKRPWSWERLKVGGEGDDRGWDGWMTSPTQWRWVWVNSGSWRWTGWPGLLHSMRSQRVGHNWATELNWTELNRSLWSHEKDGMNECENPNTAMYE